MQSVVSVGEGIGGGGGGGGVGKLLAAREGPHEVEQRQVDLDMHVDV